MYKDIFWTGLGFRQNGSLSYMTGVQFKGINLVGFETGFFMLMDFWEKD